MRILFTTLHLRPSAQAVPLAAGCLAAALPPPLRKAVRLLDFYPAQEQTLVREEIVGWQPDLIAFSLYVWNRVPLLALARELRRDLPAVRLVAGGPEATADPAGVLKEGELDWVVRGEGEEPFARLAEIVSRGESPAGLAGITWWEGDEPVAGPEPSPPCALDRFPSPWLSGVLEPAARSGVLWEVSRGGGPGCDFCLDGRPADIRHLAAERLEAELDLFVRSGVTEIRILDPAFNFPPERGKELLRLLLRRAPHVRFRLDGRAEFIDAETAQLLAQLRASVRFEQQSLRPEILCHLHRKLDPKLLSRNLHLLRAEGGRFQLELNFGLPGDDHQGFCASVEAALDLRPSRLKVSPLMVFPGTPLYRNRQRFGMVVQERPPYEILESATYGASDRAASCRLAAALELFYNRGRAAGFFAALLQAVGQDSVPFLEGFLDWATGPGGVTETQLLSTEDWQAADILSLQEGYAAHRLREEGQAGLIPAALDVIRYHFHCAETMGGEETAVRPQPYRGELWHTQWRTAPGVRLASFTYEILDLLEMGDIQLDQFVALFRPVGSVALFTRREHQVLCESLEENFSRLLRGSDGNRSPQEIFSGSVSRQEGEEIVEFAVAEGLLVPAA